MKKFITALIFCLTVLFAIPVNADTSVQKVGGCVFIGEYADKLQIKVDNGNFFHASIMNPGDKWESTIVLKNPGSKDIEAALIEIVNNLSDTRLIDALNLRIVLDDGTVVYDGKYSATGKPVIDWFKLKSGQQVTITVYTEFPGDCGNGYQNAQFDADWIFEVRAEKDTPTPDNPTPTPDKPTPTPDKPTPTPSTPTPTPSTPTPTPTESTVEKPTPDDKTPDPTNKTETTTNPGPTDSSSQKDDNVQTGDSLPIVPLAAACGIAVIILFFALKKKKGGKHE